jgi:hypothetical protein
MDRITESLLSEFTAEHDLGALPQDRQFEHFAGYITVRRQHAETFDTDDIVTGSGGDTGIDAIAIILNGILITDAEAFEEHAARSNSLDVQFIFVQAERSPSFDSAKIGQFQFGVLDFFKDKPVLVQNAAVKEAAAIMSAIYSKSSKFKRGNPSCRLFYVTTGRWQNDPVLEARRSVAVADLQATGLFGEVEFQCIGADAIQKLYSQTKNAISREFLFNERTVVPEIPGVSEAYLGFIPAPIFLSIVTDENREVIKSLFYDNVRDWEDYNPVNDEIRKTIQSDHKARFVLMNNGVTIIAQTIRPTGNRFYIEDFQIVNGCQTTHVLADQRTQIDDSVMIPLRLIGTQDEDVIRSIIHATNRQTEVKPEQFFALTDFAKKLELFFQTFSNGKKLFYERRAHQYDSTSVEKTRIVTPGNLIRAFAATFLAEPHSTTRSYGALQDKVGKEIFADGHRLEPYYVAAYTLYKLEYLFRNQRLAPEYKPARFHILLAVRLLANAADLPKPNSHEMERYCRVIMDILWDATKADELFVRAAQAVEMVAGGNFHRDNIRTLPFTQAVVRHCSKEPGSEAAT